MKMIPMEGRRFGKLTVTGYTGSRYGGRASRAAWHCRCDCGTDTIKTGAHLREREGTAQSCGCINRARFKKRKDRRRLRFAH